MTDSGSPTVRRRELGALLRALRADAGLTVEEVAKELLCSPSKVSRMETGERAVRPRDIRDLIGLYKVIDQLERDRLTALAEEGRRRAWWHRYDLQRNFAKYVGLEDEAVRLSSYESGVFPGLLHTPEYALAIHEASLPRLGESEIAKRIELRLGRQAILTRKDPPPPKFQAIIDEAALHRIIGGPIVMKAQLERAIQVAALPNVTIQILGYEAGAHPALDSKFILLEFAGQVPPEVYVEGLVGQLSVVDSDEVKRYKEVYQNLKLSALSERESLDLMAKLARSY